ncbi:MAG: hypothetical protein HIU85_11305 [Proteobacteria bacterium]|nr:hypothetical protein [Pseudomonadota bacterium]
MGPPRDFIRWVRDRADVRTFVESGTFQGETSSWAADLFDEVITIELSPEIHKQTSARLSSKSNIAFRLGDTKSVLPSILPAMRDPAIFWLDAHWSGLNTAGREQECPLLEEVALLNASSVDHFVLIDDARLFTAPPPLPHRASAWPTIWEVYEALQGGSSSRFVIITRDVIIAVPEQYRAGVIDYWQAWKEPELSASRDVMRRLTRRLRS